VADDPTPGELRIMFDNVLTVLGDIRAQMATKEFVNAKFDAFHDRVSRLEQDQKDWARTSTEAHVALDRDSKARHAETQADLEALDVKVHARIDKVKTELQLQVKAITEEQKSDQREIKSVRNGRVTAWIGIGLTWLGGLVIFFLDRGQP
jgi:flagellar motility protein MotE (MotC chaperone)